MAHKLANEFLRLEARNKGAELISVKDIKRNKELLWQADKEIWPRHAPILFPIVGKLKDNSYHYKGKTYQLPQHGFARDKDFNLVENNGNEMVFKLLSDEETLAVYPFQFELYVVYRLIDKSFYVSYKVLNRGEDLMFFSIGAHPGFNICLEEGEQVEDYHIHFSKPETAERHLLTEGLYNGQTKPVLNDTDTLPLTKQIFDNDALVFKNLKSQQVSIRNKRGDYELSLDFTGFPYLGIWSKPGTNVPFVCLEPWHGLSDHTDHKGDITQKEGIITLHPEHGFDISFRVDIL